ncbi:MAG: sigma-70 family RNA polymerase sigma factor [Planctomycetota bacterium]
MPEPEHQHLWEEYGRTRSDAARNQLIEVHFDLVVYHAQQVARRAPVQVDPCEFYASGTFGLIRAIERFDAGRGLKFTSFASHRVRGAMLDELRQLDPLPRNARTHARRWDNAADAHRAETGREPTTDDIATRLGVSRKEALKLAQSNRLENATYCGNRIDAATVLPLVPAAGAEFVQHIENTDDIRVLMQETTSRQAEALRLVYECGLNGAEAGRHLGCSGPNIHALLHQSYKAMRAYAATRQATETATRAA